MTKRPQRVLRLVPKPDDGPACGLCGKRSKVTTTECCGNTICDDLHKYVPFSYSRESCYRNHSNQTICAYHHNQQHSGQWKECALCRHDQPAEMYAWFVTNEYNFDKLENPPEFEPTRCGGCGRRIILSEESYSRFKGKHWCDGCDPHQEPPRGRRTKPRG